MSQKYITNKEIYVPSEMLNNFLKTRKRENTKKYVEYIILEIQKLQEKNADKSVRLKDLKAKLVPNSIKDESEFRRILNDLVSEGIVTKYIDYDHAGRGRKPVYYSVKRYYLPEEFLSREDLIRELSFKSKIINYLYKRSFILDMVINMTIKNTDELIDLLDVPEYKSIIEHQISDDNNLLVEDGRPTPYDAVIDARLHKDERIENGEFNSEIYRYSMRLAHGSEYPFQSKLSVKNKKTRLEFNRYIPNIDSKTGKITHFIDLLEERPDEFELSD